MYVYVCTYRKKVMQSCAQFAHTQPRRHIWPPGPVWGVGRARGDVCVPDPACPCQTSFHPNRQFENTIKFGSSSRPDATTISLYCTPAATGCGEVCTPTQCERRVIALCGEIADSKVLACSVWLTYLASQAWARPGALHGGTHRRADHTRDARLPRAGWRVAFGYLLFSIA